MDVTILYSDQKLQICKLLRSPRIGSKEPYDNPIPTRFLAPIDCLKIPAQDIEEIDDNMTTRKLSGHILENNGY